MKQCGNCKRLLSPERFNKDRSRKDGLCRVCKECNADKCRAWDLENKARVSERNKQKYARNPERERERAAAWRAQNPDRKKAADRMWYEKNNDKKRSARREYYETHLVSMREKSLAYYRKSSGELSDSYVRSVLTKKSSLRACEVPDSLVAVHKELLKLKRELKGLKNEKC